MCEFIRRIMTPPGTGGLEAAAQQALDAKKKASEDAALATAGDSELARRAAEMKLRQQLSAGGFSQFAAGPAPAVGYRQAFGS